MYDYNIKKLKENQLKDIGKNGKIIDWASYKLKSLELATIYRQLQNKKYYRILQCGDYLEFKRFSSDNTLKLNKANFCQVRLCPLCAWRRSKKIYGQVSRVMDEALKDTDYRFIFLTLTCKNVVGEDLSKTIDNLFKAFKKLSERKCFKNIVKGWFRGLEITHNIDKTSVNYDTYHPHFHLILMVNKSYFTDSKYYLSQEKWTSLWQSCMRVDYTPIVHVTSFKIGNKTQTKKSIAEAAKYTVKANDYIINNNQELANNAVFILDGALSNRRLIAFGGELRRIHKMLKFDDAETGDLVNTDIELDLRDDLEYRIEVYHWQIGYAQYIKMDDLKD